MLAVLTLIAWVSFTAYQCCRSRRGYRTESQLREYGAPIGLLAFTVLACIWTSVALAYNQQVTEALVTDGDSTTLVATNTSIDFAPPSSSPSVTTAAQDILADLNTFFTALPLLIQDVIDEVDAVVPEVRGKLGNANQLVASLVTLEGQLVGTLSAVEGFVVDNYTCSAQCAALLGPLLNVTAQVASLAVPVAQVVQADLVSIDSSIVQDQESIDDGLSSAIAQLASINAQTTQYQSDAQTS